MAETTKVCPACKGARAVQNPSTGAPVVCPVCEGDGVVQRKFNHRPYDFAFPPTTVLANAQATVTLKAPTDYDFEWWDTVAVATSQLAYVRMEINSITFMNSLQPGNGNGVDLANWAGTAQLPYARRFPWVISKGDQVSLYLTDYSGVNNTIAIVFKGFHLIPAENQ